MTTAFRIVPRLLFGDGHAYSNPLTGSGDEASVTSIQRDDLVNWHQSWFHPNNATMIVTGDISLKRLVPELERAFGGWKKGRAPEKKIDSVAVASKRKVYLIDKPGAPQSVLVATHISKPGGHPEDLAMETVTRLFGGMSTSRLNRNLRLDKHWSYGAFGLLFDARGQRPFIVVAPVQTDKTKESMIELTKEIQGIAGQRPITGEEFDSIKRNMTLRLPGRFETLGSLESAAVDLINYPYPANYYAEYANNVRRLSENDLNSAAASFIDPENLTWIVIGDLEKVEAGVRELGYGEIIRLGADGRPIAGP